MSEPDDPLPEGTLISHLLELRSRLLRAFIAVLIAFLPCAYYANQIFDFLSTPLVAKLPPGQKLIATTVTATFTAPLKLAFVAGLLIAMPYVLYQIWAFVAPGLHTREKRWSYLFLGAAIPLFGIGITLCYLSLGRSMHYLLGLTPGGVQNLIQVDQYLSFAMAMMLAFGLAFEVPLLIVMLNLAGILTHERFRKWRRVLIFGVFLIAGMANPSPDPVTMLILGGACAVLVEVAEFIVWANDRRRTRLHPDPYAGLADDELSPLPSVGRGED